MADKSKNPMTCHIETPMAGVRPKTLWVSHQAPRDCSACDASAVPAAAGLELQCHWFSERIAMANPLYALAQSLHSNKDQNPMCACLTRLLKASMRCSWFAGSMHLARLSLSLRSHTSACSSSSSSISSSGGGGGGSGSDSSSRSRSGVIVSVEGGRRSSPATWCVRISAALLTGWGQHRDIPCVTAAVL
jgi:uncharacterized membrane protein YgcG